MEFDMSRHNESVVLQGSSESLEPIIKQCEKAQIPFFVSELTGLVELLVPLDSEESARAFAKIEKAFAPRHLYLQYSQTNIQDRWRRKARRFRHPSNPKVKGTVHAHIKHHFDELLKPLNVESSFYDSPLYTNMLYYIMEDFITGSSRYIRHTPPLISDEYIQLIQTWDAKKLKKYQAYKLQTLEDLGLI